LERDPAQPAYQGELQRRGYRATETLGGGAFAMVMKAESLKGASNVAIKIMSRRNFIDRGIAQQLDREGHLLRNLEHENIVPLLDFWESGDAVFVVLEFCELGDLSQVLARDGKLSEQTTAFYMRQLLHALACVHQFPAVHRDVKPDNLLLTSKFVLKLTDFGWAAEIEPDGRRRTLSGTFQYMAPEVLQSEDHDEKVDSWSAGAVMYEMLTARPLLQTFIGQGATGLSLHDPRRSTSERQRRLLAEIGGLDIPRILLQLNLSIECEALLRGLLCVNREHRLRCEDAQFTSFVNRPADPLVLQELSPEKMNAKAPDALVDHKDIEVPTPERRRRGDRDAYTPPVAESPKLVEVEECGTTTTASTSPSPAVRVIEPLRTVLFEGVAPDQKSSKSGVSTVRSGNQQWMRSSQTSRYSPPPPSRPCPSPPVPPRASPAQATRVCSVYRVARQGGADRLSATASGIAFEQPTRSVTAIPADLNSSLCADQLSASVRSQSDLNYAPRPLSNYRPSRVQDPLQRTVPNFSTRQPEAKRSAHVTMPLRGSRLNPHAHVAPSKPHRMIFVAPPRAHY
jgi:serine/threonine protein kinase